MAGQPDIQSILAALAQQSAATPSQSTPAPPQQPGLPPGYPNSLPQQMPQVATPSLGGFALPQPSNSGSVDLSAIRPVNSGSVSIADAIAKAKSIAADRGINYDNRPPPAASPREDPRLAGRSYRRSRSRSRSPPRRDNFRDNYNPYRDERRDADRRDRGYPRDRSPSPRPRGGGGGGRDNFSPAPGRGVRSPPNRGAAPAGAADSETISVKSSLVGLIIGRQGENLRRVESETGARVQFIQGDPTAVHRQCTITGSLRARENAKREIFRVMDDNGGSAPPESRGPGPAGPGRGNKQPQAPPALREGENSLQIMVPDKTVGLIIGRGGETIRDLQERSGCHVNIVAENKSINGLRPVNLIGTPQASAIAKEMILEIVESDTRPPPGGPPDHHRGGGGGGAMDSYRGGAGGGAGGGNDRGNDAGKISEDIFVPSEAVGMIIGKGGETIKEMQGVTGCKINVSQPQQPDIQRQIGLVGSRAAIEEAKRAIYEKVETVQQRDREGGGRDRGPRQRNDGGYGNQYSQPQQQQYGQPQMGGAPQSMPGMPQMPAMGGMPGMAQPGAPAPAGGDPNAADPYAPYGGYNNYLALWYAAIAQQGQGGGQGQQPPMPQ